MKKTILVSGDLVWDTHLARLNTAPQGYFQTNEHSQQEQRHGGAWFVAQLIGQALARHRIVSGDDVDADVIQPEQPVAAVMGSAGGVAPAFSVWAWHGKDEKDKNAAWHISEFLGCQQVDWSSAKPLPVSPSVSAAPDLLVIDDLGLGFASHEEAWPDCLRGKAAAPQRVLIKGGAPFDRPLYTKLLAREEAEKVSVVMSAAALRDQGASLSCGESWDRTLEEIQAEFQPGGLCWALRFCRRVVVAFGRSGAAVFSRVPRTPAEAGQPADTLQFERFVFDAAVLEDTWGRELPKMTFGTGTAMAAVMAVHELMDVPPSSHLTMSRGLSAARWLHRLGAGNNPKALDLTAAEKKAFVLDKATLPERDFRSAYPRDLLDACELNVSDCKVAPSLLTDALGNDEDFLRVAALNVVHYGPKRSLRSVPQLSMGNFCTVDREEIESLNTVRHLIVDYVKRPTDRRPLSIAVFGPPGSGKSFAIKEIAAQLYGKERTVIEINLSQIPSLTELHEAFHRVRDASVKGQIPLVFWDEFDTSRDGEPLGWLKEFLAPMQDSHFVAHGNEHPFGKCIFIFAGGTSATFQAFDKSRMSFSTNENERGVGQHFREVKGPDFISRLRGHVNVKGPNPREGSSVREDPVCMLRRALLLRSLIQKHHPAMIDAKTERLAMTTVVANAFISAGCYLHGARSMEAIVSLSKPSPSQRFGPSALPQASVVMMHVTSDFITIAGDRERYHISPEDVDSLAREKHEAWLAAKQSQGYAYGEKRSDIAPKTHPLLLPWDKLSDDDRDANRNPASLGAQRLAALGFEIRSATTDLPATPPLDADTLRKLCHAEHRRWMREKLLQGRAWAEKTDDALYLHADLRSADLLGADEASLDRSIIDALLAYLNKKGLILVQKP